MAINRGEIFFVRLDPIVGREIGGDKRRPVLVLSINDINRKPLVVTVVPGTGTTRPERAYRNEVIVPPTPRNGLRVPTTFLCHQIRAIDHARFLDAPVGWIDPVDLHAIEAAVRFSLGLGAR
ncbi:MAG TPA: type II toxin-antitoxin system PemK/MazF family toxin [Tepidisphaeraceae bacterium]|nr:type II toxin-antitoxin system PemK/MazF family toxin [Tepidisphaeraceae bacterium]